MIVKHTNKYIIFYHMCFIFWYIKIENILIDFNNSSTAGYYSVNSRSAPAAFGYEKLGSTSSLNSAVNTPPKKVQPLPPIGKSNLSEFEILQYHNELKRKLQSDPSLLGVQKRNKEQNDSSLVGVQKQNKERSLNRHELKQKIAYQSQILPETLGRTNSPNITSEKLDNFDYFTTQSGIDFQNNSLQAGTSKTNQNMYSGVPRSSGYNNYS